MDIEPEVIETPEVETEVEQEAVETDVGEGAPEDAGLVVEIGGEEEPDEPEHFKEVRRKYREAQKRLKELEARAAAPAQQQLRPKPTAEDHDYDNEAFAADLEKWFEEKREHDARFEEVKAVQEKAEQRWQSRLAFYDEGKEKLGAQDYEEAEATVAEVFSAPFPGILAEDVRMGIIKQGAKDPAALVYALGKNPAKAKELAAIEDPVEFAFRLGAMEAGMKVIRNGKPPAPERKITGTVPGVAGALDNTLERLREEAAKTGDYSKVAAYKREKRG